MIATGPAPTPPSPPPAVSLSWILSVVTLLLAILIHVSNDFAPFDTYLPPTEIDASTEGHFSGTYYEARGLFRQRAQAANAKLHAIAMPHLPSHLNLTIDVAVFHGSRERALLHISGTHGVEGFAGSGIQCALLERLANATTAEKYPPNAPTLIFVHALNPYGMAMLRRFNEHNVDLNRNFLTPEGFTDRRQQNPNAYGYADLLDALNPTEPTRTFAWLKVYKKLLQAVWSKGIVQVKRAIVGGNYHFPRTIFYGGQQLEPSAKALFEIVREHLDVDALRVLGVIDVHTGLGPAGYDTLMMKTGDDIAAAHGIFRDRTPVISGDNADDAASGYEGATGYVATGLDWFLPKHVASVSLTQEFGTVAGVFVLEAMIQENAMFHHAPERRLPYAERLRDVFYLHRSPQWKADVISRGLIVWEELVSYVSSATVAAAH